MEYSTLDACIEDSRRRTADPVLLATVEYLVARVRKAESDADKLKNELAILRERQDRDARDRFVSDSESLNGGRRPDAGTEEPDVKAEPAPAGGEASGSAEEEASQAGCGKTAEELEGVAARLVKQARGLLKQAGRLQEQEGRKKGRKPFSEKLQLIELISDLPEDLQFCSECGGPLVKFGARTAGRTIFRPASFIRVKEHAARYLCLRCSNIRPTEKHARQLKARIAACGGSAEIIKFLKDLVVKFGSGKGVDEIRRLLEELEAEPAGSGEAAESRGGDKAGNPSGGHAGAGSAEAGCACGGHAGAVAAEAECTEQPKADCAGGRTQAKAERRLHIEEAPTMAIIPHSWVDAAFVAFVIMAKYFFGIPLHRQERMFASHGMEISRRTMCNWILWLGGQLEEFNELFRQQLVAGSILCSDETTAQVHREEGRADTLRSYIWALFGGGGSGPPVCYFEYNISRASYVIKNIIKGFKGFFQSDGYSGYNCIKNMEGVVKVGCLAHVRRRFFDVVKAALKTLTWEQITESSSAYRVLIKIMKVYLKEKQLRARNLKPSEFLAAREAEVRPILDSIRKMVEEVGKTTNPKGLLGRACSYAIDQWDYVCNYMKNPDLTPDNNYVERELVKPFVMGRKNFLFFDSPKGAKAACIFYTLIHTAKACGHDPERCLATLFRLFPRTPREQWSTLLPWNLKQLDPLPQADWRCTAEADMKEAA